MLQRLYIDNYKCYSNNGPVRVKRITETGDEGLPISELFARGWIHMEKLAMAAPQSPLIVNAPPSLQIAMIELQRIV